MATYTISGPSAIQIEMINSETTEITNTGSLTVIGDRAIIVKTDSILSYILNDGTIIENGFNCILFFNKSPKTTFGTLTNNNIISCTGASNISLQNSIVNKILNNGSILCNVNGIELYSNTDLSILENNNTIQCGAAIVINGSTISSYLTNTDNIISNDSYGIEIENGSINTLNNSGTIQSATRNGLLLTPPLPTIPSQINTLNNFGSIVNIDGNYASIYCGSGSFITTLNNLQDDLTYDGSLPINYNIIINSIIAGNYGILQKFTSGTLINSLNFGIESSSTLTAGTYVGVLQGLDETNVDAGTRSGTFGSFNWELINVDTETGQWDLIVTELPPPLPINPACWPQIGGPQPPRLWSREEGDCIEPITPQFQEELNMRRKAEILKYKANSAQLTKKQQWSQNVRGAGPNGKRVWANQNVYGSNPNTQNLPRIGNTLQLPCINNNGITCSPSNASDVPGPNIKLCYNPNIPLVNYKVQRTYLAGGTKWPFIGQK